MRSCSICRRLTADEPPILQRLAVFADPWPGAVAIWRSADGASFERAALAFAPSIIGETLDDLPRGPTSRFDHVRRVRVQLYGGALASVSDAALFAGANAAALQRPDGAWEVLPVRQCRAGRRAHLRTVAAAARAGRQRMGDGRSAAGGRAVRAARRARRRRSRAGSMRSGRPCSFASSRPTATTAIRPTVALTATPTGDRAAAACRRCICARRRTVDGVTFTWIRRTRRDGDSWDAIEVPLGETSEAYELDVLDGSTVKRTLTARRAIGALRGGRRDRRFRRGADEPHRPRRATLGHRRPRHRGRKPSSHPEAP